MVTVPFIKWLGQGCGILLYEKNFSTRTVRSTIEFLQFRCGRTLVLRNFLVRTVLYVLYCTSTLVLLL